jgi:copper(I)-binding protein
MKRLILLAAALLVSCSKSGGSSDLRISDAWARETMAGHSTTAAYMTIANHGTATDELVSVAAPTPAMAMIHSSTNDYGITRMRLVTELPIPAGGTVALKPGGEHVMVMRLQRPLKPGHTLRLTLRFRRSGELPVDVPVLSAAAAPAQ